MIVRLTSTANAKEATVVDITRKMRAAGRKEKVIRVRTTKVQITRALVPTTKALVPTTKAQAQTTKVLIIKVHLSTAVAGTLV